MEVDIDLHYYRKMKFTFVCKLFFQPFVPQSRTIKYELNIFKKYSMLLIIVRRDTHEKKEKSIVYSRKDIQCDHQQSGFQNTYFICTTQSH